MPLNWIDTKNLSFNYLLLLEQVQISWMEGWIPQEPLAIALSANPVVAWYLRHKCPQIKGWLDEVTSHDPGNQTAESVKMAEQEVMKTINDWLVYVVDPDIYDSQPFLKWDTGELIRQVDFEGSRVLDIGAGTGRLTFTAASKASAVYAVEPVSNLRAYIKKKARRLGFDNIFAVDGLITEIPFQPRFADITMAGFVFGGVPEQEIIELERVTRQGGWVILYPGNVDRDTPAHEALVNHGYRWSRFEAPGDGWKRSYRKQIT